MKDIGRIITQETFINSFRILKNYIVNKDDVIQDINLILIAEYLCGLNEIQVKKFYNKYVSTGLIYSLPEFYSSDLVTIPKGFANIREYRFFSTFGLIFYNALGIFFAETCAQVLEKLNFERRRIFSYTPTSYTKAGQEWEVRNNWKSIYSKYKGCLSEATNESDIVLSIDIQNFFNSIDHKKLISIIDDFITAEIRAKYSYNGISEGILNFYLHSVMGLKRGLPQGKKNFASDYLAYLYMSKFDMELENLVSESKYLKFAYAVRYVDDIHIFFCKTKNSNNSLVYKELNKIEHSISKWLYQNLFLSLNEEKTYRNIIEQPIDKKSFLKETEKRVSRVGMHSNSTFVVNNMVDDFIAAVQTFKYPDDSKFKNDMNSNIREDLKNIFEKPVRNRLSWGEGLSRMTQVLRDIEIELSATQFNIIGTLFLIENKVSRPYLSILNNYFYANFNPNDKRHIHILLQSILSLDKNNKLSTLVAKNKSALMKDDYGKYLVLYEYPRIQLDSTQENRWDISYRVYSRLSLECRNKPRCYPYIYKDIHHSFKSILFANSINSLDAVYTACCGYIHEYTQGHWSVALNKLQIVLHESLKSVFYVKENDKIFDIIKKISEKGLRISVYEERDLIRLWNRRNFSPNSHGSKDGLTSPEVTKAELDSWEIKVSALLDKVFYSISV